MQLEIADIATNEKKRLSGFKVLGVFPFYLRYINVGTHIQLCKIREQINRIAKEDPKLSDFYNADLQEQIVPFLIEYCLTALINRRSFSWFFRYFLRRKLEKCGHYHILNLYITIHKLDEPAFFLSYWNLMKQTDNTLLKAEKPS